MNKIKLNLRMFDGEGAGASTGATGEGLGEGNTSLDATGKEAVATQPSQEERIVSFEKLIKGDYKDLYTQQTQAMIDKRFKETKGYETQLNQLSPVIELLAGRYGVDANNLEELSRAIQDDTSYYEDEALDMGLTVEQLKLQKQLQRENEQYRKQFAEQQARAKADETYNKWNQEAEQLKVDFPNFDLASEIENKDFLDLIKNGIPLAHAYKVAHLNDILGGAMQYTVEQTKQQVINNIQARGNRPSENGIQTNAAMTTKKDVSTLTKKERQAYAERAARGEKITFQS